MSALPSVFLLAVIGLGPGCEADATPTLATGSAPATDHSVAPAVKLPAPPDREDETFRPTAYCDLTPKGGEHKCLENFGDADLVLNEATCVRFKGRWATSGSCPSADRVGICLVASGELRHAYAPTSPQQGREFCEGEIGGRWSDQGAPERDPRLIVSCVSRADDTCDEQTLYLTRAATKVESECKEFDKTFAVGPCKSDGRVGTCSHTARKSHYYAPRYSAASAKPECEQHRGRFVAP